MENTNDQLSQERRDRGPSIHLVTIPRGSDAEFRIELAEFKGRRYIGLRQWNKAPGGEWRPDPKRGCSIKLRELEAVIAALNKATELTKEAGSW